MILEAADWGLCLAAPIVSRNREENKAIIGLLRPGLDGNELWFFLGSGWLHRSFRMLFRLPLL